MRKGIYGNSLEWHIVRDIVCFSIANEQDKLIQLITLNFLSLGFYFIFFLFRFDLFCSSKKKKKRWREFGQVLWTKSFAAYLVRLGRGGCKLKKWISLDATSNYEITITITLRQIFLSIASAVSVASIIIINVLVVVVIAIWIWIKKLFDLFCSRFA